MKNNSVNNKDMSNNINSLYYNDAIVRIKNTIIKSRYKAASLANRELLSLYFSIGEYVSHNTRNKNWGTGAIEIISDRLQQELPGLRGFSATNIKNMRLFYEEWKDYIQIRQLPTAEFESVENQDSSNRQLATGELLLPINTQIRQMQSAEFETTENQNSLNRQLTTDDLVEPKNNNIQIRQLATDDLKDFKINNFLQIGFTIHIEIIIRVKSIKERLFYIEQCATYFWTVEKLKYNLKSNLFGQKGKLQNNFENTIQDNKFREFALNSFKDELLLDFINITDPDEEPDERVLEYEIVNNIKKFIMAVGTDFSFIGNQYRIMIDDEEFFIDLLFFNRKLQSLVAIELKKGKFKAEYAGKMNLYLSALDEYVKLKHENPSIGIILCKEKNHKVVEFSFRDTSKPMGVAIYKTAKELPVEYRNILPDAAALKQLL
jgi:predicted nuclease of restriction endonuclease-like (RecB) superfamily